jgi:cell division transport system permease protein
MLISPLTTMVTVMTIAVSLFLLGGFILGVENVGRAFQTKQGQVGVALFIKDGTSKETVNLLSSEVRKIGGISAVILRTKEEALIEFKKSLGKDSGVLEGLEQSNPLPASIELSLDPYQPVMPVLRKLEELQRARPEILKVHYAEGVLQDLASLLKGVRLGGGITIMIVLLITAFIIANTIRLALYSHRGEIEVMQLVGATPSYVRIPYMFEGALEGAFGALVAVAALVLCYSVARELFISSFLASILSEPHFLSVRAVFMLFLTGIALGVLGSYFALRRFMREQ